MGFVGTNFEVKPLVLEICERHGIDSWLFFHRKRAVGRFFFDPVQLMAWDGMGSNGLEKF